MSTLGRTNEARDETETKPRESHILQERVFVLIIAFVCFALFHVIPQYPRDFIGNLIKERKHNEQNKIIGK